MMLLIIEEKQKDMGTIIIGTLEATRSMTSISKMPLAGKERTTVRKTAMAKEDGAMSSRRARRPSIKR